MLSRGAASAGVLLLLAAMLCAISTLVLPPPVDVSAGPGARSAAAPQCGWRHGEILRGKCPGSLKSIAGVPDAAACEQSCCADAGCITFQWREDTGCRQGGDVRVGMEKDGPGAWCEPEAPAPWLGQRIDAERTACARGRYNPEELPGQCFGLGPERKSGSASAESCRDACCASATCKMWQFREDKGCFFGPRGHGCDDGTWEPYYGKRKWQATRTYGEAPRLRAAAGASPGAAP